MCQGKMPISVRKRYEKQKQELSRENIDNLIEKLENIIQNNYSKN